MDCRYKNPLNFGLFSTQNGRVAAILNFCYSMLSMQPNCIEVPRREC